MSQINFCALLRRVACRLYEDGINGGKALENYPYHTRCFGYSFEGVSRPDTLVDITQDIDDKIEAMQERRSQVKLVNDEDQIRSTHMYALSSKNHERYCERFNIYSREKYVQIAKDLGLIKT